ncbi:unnamed protein product, partial [Polarella glacialis]
MRPSPIVQSSKQERQGQGTGPTTIWYSSGNSGKDLWKLKAHSPELFADQAASDAVPPGFEPTTSTPGLYYNRNRKVFFLAATRKILWLEEESGEYRDLYDGQSLSHSFTGGASSLGDSLLRPGVKAAARPKIVVIPDLHRVASALKADLGHIDRPFAMLGVFGGGDCAEKADVAARGFHEKLVRRLEQSRSRWSDAALSAAVRGALDDVTLGQAETVPAAVTVLTGLRVAALASPGSSFRLTLRPAQASSSTLAPPALSTSSSSSSSPGPSQGVAAEKLAITSSCLTLGETQSLFVALTAGETKMVDEDSEGLMAPQILKGWPRTASIALLRAARQRGASGPLAVACAHISPLSALALSGGKEPEVPAAKRQKMGPSMSSPFFTAGTAAGSGGGKADQVRLRQILLRCVAPGPPVLDPVRRKQVKRGQEEAEAEMLRILAELESDGLSSFQKVCREVSECPSALKGGELAGDIGWLDRTKGVDIQQDKSKVAVRPQVPAAVLKAAFELGVGEVHDLVTSDLGVHLLQRPCPMIRLGLGSCHPLSCSPSVEQAAEQRKQLWNTTLSSGKLLVFCEILRARASESRGHECFAFYRQNLPPSELPSAMTRPTPGLVGENPELVRGPAECIAGGSGMPGRRRPEADRRSSSRSLVDLWVGGFGSSGNRAVRGRQDIYRGPAHPCRFPEPQNGHAWCLTEEAKQEALAEPKDAAAEVLSAADSAGSADDADDAEDDERQQEKERREEERKEKAAAKEQRRMREREEAAVAAAVATAAAKAAESVQRPTDEEAQPPELGADSGAAPEQVDSNPGRMPYSWIRSDNMEPARQARRDIARATRQATVAGAYKKNMGKAPRGDHVRLDKVRAMINGTERLAPSLGNLSVDAEPTGYRSTEISKHDGLTIPVALTLRARHSDRVAVVSAASAYHCGGGFTSGGRHALEEATCVQTTLFESLEKVQIE